MLGPGDDTLQGNERIDLSIIGKQLHPDAGVAQIFVSKCNFQELLSVLRGCHSSSLKFQHNLERSVN